MKEYPKFDYNGKSFDLCFYDETIQLYAVQNKFSGMMVSQLIPAANDYVAALGFADFIAKQSEKGDKEIYTLIRVATLNIQEISIQDTERLELLENDDVEKFLEEAKLFMISFSDGD